MNKIKVFASKNYKVVIGIIIGITISIVIGVSAVATKDVVYDNSKSGLTSTNLQGAIDELNTKATTKINEAKKECPDGYRCIKQNIVVSYTYNQTSGANNYCITGEEETCAETSCYKNKTAGSCPAGTIIKYKVNDVTEKYFYVLHDDGETMTLQQRENTLRGYYWNSNGTVNDGPIDILSSLESETSDWTNVNDQTYTMGTTNFNNTNAYTGCSSYNSCTTNTYTLGQRTGKARMITVQEAVGVGCTESSQSCPIWMYNYLWWSTNDGGTIDDDSTIGYNAAYNTMSANPLGFNNSDAIYEAVWKVRSAGRLQHDPVYSPAPPAAVRAVIVINK